MSSDRAMLLAQENLRHARMSSIHSSAVYQNARDCHQTTDEPLTKLIDDLDVECAALMEVIRLLKEQANSGE